jgi:UDP-N-acetylglucosamine diphosphorylase / glucose-1-phosphate thymidylyltransferase / UDP-N-acetylgalactosamine diphosphorylase / glucosamine-1-phosphate N-acetyltransferase / galactosamine-1-phosphate N-acetyltransferase
LPKTSIRHAVVLAAGRGKRMGEATSELPKPMLTVGGRPMLEHVLERLAAAGLEKLLVVVGYHRELIEEHFRGWPVEFRVQDPVDGTGSAARLGREFVGEAPFLLTFGDILCAPPAYQRCARVLEDHPETVAVLGVREVEDPWRGAAVYEQDGRVRRVVEKPPKGSSTTRWNSAGLFALRPVAFRYLDRLTPSPRNEYELTAIFDMMLAEGLEVRVSSIEGIWRDVGYPSDLDAANAEV